MYGTKQAPREWYRALDDLMTSVGYARSTSDSCVYSKTVNRTLVIIAIYVDDGLILCKDASIIASELAALHKFFALKRLGRLSYFLSLEVEHTKDGVMIHQSKYVKDIVERYGFATPSRARATTPMEDCSSLDPSSPPFSNIERYQSAVGALQYAAQFSRPDIAVAVRAAAQKVVSPSLDDWSLVKRIFLYLSNTPDYGIVYSRGASLTLSAYSDASWADDPESRRSVGGYVVLLSGGAVSWRSKQQSLIATSTTESEMNAASDTAKEVIALRHLSNDLNNFQPKSTVIFEDNSACISIANNPSSHGRTKHFDVVQLWVRERIAIGDIVLQYINTNENTADVFTKALARSKFEHHRRGLGMTSLASWIRGSIV
jgi:hypothetical protein